MLETTFLGHQGWQFATRRARILIDPLLVEPFGHGGAVGQVFPPRDLNIAAMGPLDAVVFTHEHEDHFNIPTLNRISRDVPIFVPERSSVAMRQFLNEVGFAVKTIAAGHVVEIGDLQLATYSTDHVRHDEQDEWETTPFLVLDTVDGGSFFSPVDVAVSATIEAQLRQRGINPGLFAYANNVMNMSFQERPPGRSPATLPIAARFLVDHVRRPSPALATLMCGGGFSFTGPRAWMNNLFFPLESESLFKALEMLSPEERFIVPAPGTQIISSKDRIVSITDSASFLRTRPRNEWPDRGYKPSSVPPPGVDPASGRTELKKGELEELTQHLRSFAEFLYGSSLFKILYSLSAGTLPPKVKPSFVVSAMSGDRDHVFEYDPAASSFTVMANASPLAEYAGALECYATDLLEFLRGRIMPSALMFGRVCRWRGTSENITAAIDHALWTYGHPLRRQAQALDMYRALFAAEPSGVPQVSGRKVT